MTHSSATGPRGSHTRSGFGRARPRRPNENWTARTKRFVIRLFQNEKDVTADFTVELSSEATCLGRLKIPGWGLDLRG